MTIRHAAHIATPPYPPDLCICGAWYTTAGGYPDPVIYDAFWDIHMDCEKTDD